MLSGVVRITLTASGIVVEWNTIDGSISVQALSLFANRLGGVCSLQAYDPNLADLGTFLWNFGRSNTVDTFGHLIPGSDATCRVPTLPPVFPPSPPGCSIAPECFALVFPVGPVAACIDVAPPQGLGAVCIDTNCRAEALSGYIPAIGSTGSLDEFVTLSSCSVIKSFVDTCLLSGVASVALAVDRCGVRFGNESSCSDRYAT